MPVGQSKVTETAAALARVLFQCESSGVPVADSVMAVVDLVVKGFGASTSGREADPELALLSRQFNGLKVEKKALEEALLKYSKEVSRIKS